MNIKEQIDDMLNTAQNLEDADFVGCAVLGAAIRDWRDTLEKLYAVYKAANRHTDNPDNIELFIKLFKAIAAVESE